MSGAAVNVTYSFYQMHEHLFNSQALLPHSLTTSNIMVPHLKVLFNYYICTYVHILYTRIYDIYHPH